MDSQLKKPFSDRPYGYPKGMTEKSYAKWRKALDDLRVQEDAHRGAQRFMTCCKILQRLAESQVISDAEYTNMRSQLNDLWAESVKRLDQPGSTVVTHE